MRFLTGTGPSSVPCSSGRRRSPWRTWRCAINSWPPAVGGPTTSGSVGPGLLGLAITPVGELRVQSPHRATGHGAGLAPPRLPALRALEVPAQPGRPPETRRGAARPDPTDGAGESDVGPAPHSGRAGPPWLRGRGADRRPVHAPHVASAVAHLAHFSHRACPSHRRHRLLRGPHDSST
jgi:hypothetical protein